MFLSACGKNEAKEAANESAQVEEEGVGEVTEELSLIHISGRKRRRERYYHESEEPCY